MFFADIIILNIQLCIFNYLLNINYKILSKNSKQLIINKSVHDIYALTNFYNKDYTLRYTTVKAIYSSINYSSGFLKCCAEANLFIYINIIFYKLFKRQQGYNIFWFRQISMHNYFLLLNLLKINSLVEYAFNDFMFSYNIHWVRFFTILQPNKKNNIIVEFDKFYQLFENTLFNFIEFSLQRLEYFISTFDTIDIIYITYYNFINIYVYLTDIYNIVDFLHFSCERVDLVNLITNSLRFYCLCNKSLYIIVITYNLKNISKILILFNSLIKFTLIDNSCDFDINQYNEFYIITAVYDNFVLKQLLNIRWIYQKSKLFYNFDSFNISRQTFIAYYIIVKQQVPQVSTLLYYTDIPYIFKYSHDLVTKIVLQKTGRKFFIKNLDSKLCFLLQETETVYFFFKTEFNFLIHNFDIINYKMFLLLKQPHSFITLLDINLKVIIQAYMPLHFMAGTCFLYKYYFLPTAMDITMWGWYSLSIEFCNKLFLQQTTKQIYYFNMRIKYSQLQIFYNSIYISRIVTELSNDFFSLQCSFILYQIKLYFGEGIVKKKISTLANKLLLLQKQLQSKDIEIHLPGIKKLLIPIKKINS